MKRLPKSFMAYDIVKQPCPFTCHYAIYPHGGAGSLCYTTDEVRASLIASALAHFAASPEGAEWEQRMRDGKLKVKVLKK
jgi:hypothetical protein